MARVFRVRLSLLGMRLSRPELIETDPANLPSAETAPVKIGAAVAYILKNGRCVYDLLYVAPAATFEDGRPDFQRFVESFAKE